MNHSNVQPKGEDSLAKKAVRGGFWVFGLNFTERGLQFVRTIVLARLLSPHDFGLFGIASLVMSLLNRFSQTGFEEALVQRKERTEEYLDTAWTVQILRSVSLFILLYSLAPWAARFFQVAQASLIIRIFSICILLDGLKNIGQIYFSKELQFNRYFWYRMSGVAADFLVAITSAIILKNVWALVYGGIAGSSVRSTVSYIMIPYRPHLRFEPPKARELFNYGKWLLGGSILGYLLLEGDNFVVGKLVGATGLGLYQMAYRISTLPSTQFSQLISQVTFPVYAKLQDDLKRLRRTYQEILQVSVIIAFPLAGGILSIAREFTYLALGEKWLPMVPVLQILCVLGFIRPIENIFNALVRGTGRPDINTKLCIMQMVVMFSCIFPLIAKFGLLGAALSVVISWVIPKEIIYSIVISKRIGLPWIKIMHMLFLPSVATSIMITAVFFTKRVIPQTNFLTLSLLILVGVDTYFLTLKLFEKIFKYPAPAILINRLKSSFLTK